jgi:protein-tyrosine phosphatase
MIDMHCHMLPGIDDRSAQEDIALELARTAVGDWITTTTCKRHIYPGLFENTGEGIKQHGQPRGRYAALSAAPSLR